MNYEFYADVFFMTNFYLDSLAVFAVSEILEQKKKRLRYLLGCALSSLLGCILFLMIQNYDLYLFCIHFIVNPGMTFFCFFPAKREIYGKAFCLMYFVILLLGGSVQWMYITVANGRYYEFCLILTSVPVMVFLYILRRKRKNVQLFYDVRIAHAGKEVSVRALYDTGNRLRDPYVAKPVHVIGEEVLQKLGGNDRVSTRLIPFSSVGREKGMLKAFTAESMVVNIGGQEIELSSEVLAVAENSVFKDRNYQMILNGEFENQKERNEEERCT